ncbi:80f29f51-afcc-4875-9908-89c38a2c381d [Sclerotinia trifoliorum]|uniref:80f29f51-afcc-4875-9908-89c38a2c381d n=1 Tax=Sclerotinia trifoliorum TaxID=28548 RepID=A0A8H2ZSC6_9HELO|nr:80f29f51-afcc-4875-9908-89c38a2c381d [Sclerotinia trifoliorum]
MSPMSGLNRISLSNPRFLRTCHRSFHISSIRSYRDAQFRRSDYDGQGWTSSYEPGVPTKGPLSQASKHGVPSLTPLSLKNHLDKFVVGQDRAKKVTCVAIYNHYQRIRELKRQEAEEQERRDQYSRRHLYERERNSHPVDNEYVGHAIQTADLNAPYREREYDEEPELGSRPLEDPSQNRTIIEKSNLMLLGPSGVGKTYILQTLARVLEVPFATVDCSSLTQAGYIGTDIESSIERLLLASSHSVQKCETGIIFFDEIDKLAKPAVMTHGRDVSGEGVQQGLLKMIEGTNVTINAKSDKNAFNSSRGIDRGGRETSPPSKSEQYTIDTSNILFVFAGAFIGLEKIISQRLSTGSSIGFNSSLSSLFSAEPTKEPEKDILAHTTPTDLQNYGLIPELLGRIPITTSLSPLSLPQLVSILTEPRNSLVKQYTALFETYGSHGIILQFTKLALEAIASRALYGSSSGNTQESKGKGEKTGIGARGLRSIMESVLQEIMFIGPSSPNIRYVLVDEAFVQGIDTESSQYPTPVSSSSSKSFISSSNIENSTSRETIDGNGETRLPRCFSRNQRNIFEEAREQEEEVWKQRKGIVESKEKKSRNGSGRRSDKSMESFQEYRVIVESGV